MMYYITHKQQKNMRTRAPPYHLEMNKSIRKKIEKKMRPK